MNLVDYEIFREHLDRTGTVNQIADGRSIDLKGAPLPGMAMEAILVTVEVTMAAIREAAIMEGFKHSDTNDTW